MVQEQKKKPLKFHKRFYIKITMKKKLIIVTLAIPAFICGILGFLSVFISAPLYHLFKPKYQLPLDKAWIDVAPISNYLWSRYTKFMSYCFKRT